MGSDIGRVVLFLCFNFWRNPKNTTGIMEIFTRVPKDNVFLVTVPNKFSAWAHIYWNNWHGYTAQYISRPAIIELSKNGTNWTIHCSRLSYRMKASNSNNIHTYINRPVTPYADCCPLFSQTMRCTRSTSFIYLTEINILQLHLVNTTNVTEIILSLLPTSNKHFVIIASLIL